MKVPLKTHGGKHYLAQKIISLMPLHTHFVEPYAGGLAVLLAKPCEGISEVVNDLDGRITNFWQVLQDEDLFARFQRRVQVIPFSQNEWRRPSRIWWPRTAVWSERSCSSSCAGRVCQGDARNSVR